MSLFYTYYSLLLVPIILVETHPSPNYYLLITAIIMETTFLLSFTAMAYNKLADSDSNYYYRFILINCLSIVILNLMKLANDGWILYSLTQYLRYYGLYQ